MSDLILSGKEFKLLVEKLGVPDNIDQTAIMLYNGISKYLKETKDYMTGPGFNFNLNGNFIIGDFSFNSINIFINVEPVYGMNKLKITGGASKSDYDFNKENLIVTAMNYSIENSSIGINLQYMDNSFLSRGEVRNLFIRHKKYIIDMLTHELKHTYDRYKKPTNKIHTLTDYNSTNNYKTNVPPINTFIYYMYYTSNIENLVRSSEIYSSLKQNKVTKSNFVEYMDKNSIIIKLKEIRDFNFEKDIVGKIKTNNVKDIEHFLAFNNRNIDISEFTIDQKVDLFLKLVWIGIENIRNQSMVYYIPNFYDEINDIISKNKKYFNKHYNLTNADKYFNAYKNEEKQMKQKADQMIKKLYKIYDLLEQKVNIMEKLFPVKITIY